MKRDGWSRSTGTKGYVVIEGRWGAFEVEGKRSNGEDSKDKKQKRGDVGEMKGGVQGVGNRTLTRIQSSPCVRGGPYTRLSLSVNSKRKTDRDRKSGQGRRFIGLVDRKLKKKTKKKNKKKKKKKKKKEKKKKKKISSMEKARKGLFFPSGRPMTRGEGKVHLL